VAGALVPGGTGRELCDTEVQDALRRRSLARLRRAVEPVEPRALARLLTEWQGLTQRRRGRDALLAVVAELEGCPLVGSALEREILPARLDGYRGWDLDALCASGEVVWAGLEPLGASDGRVALYLADHEPALARPVVEAPGPVAAALRETLSRRGAVFFADLARAVGGFPAGVLEALWAMVWAGEVTNDTLEPLRSRGHAAAGETTRRQRTRPAARAPRTGPPGSEGRWSLRAARWGAPVPETDRRAALARALLDRYGVVTRESAHAEGIEGGFSAVYEVLKALEERGRVRRGYFVAGRGGAQFALPGADERLRAMRDPDEAAPTLVLAATDPANAYGATLDWPASPEGTQQPQRAAGAVVVVRDGELLGWLGRAGRALLTFLPEGDPARSTAARALARALATTGAGARALLVSTIDAEPATSSALAGVFVDAGFFATARGLMRRVERPDAGARAASEGARR
jgi:ATP-dependent Lhr-like helicase